MTISKGDTFPSVKIKEKTAEGPVDLDIGEFLAGRKVVLIGMPGAFTPTCTLNHLPGYLEHRDAFYARGVDEIAVICVNDSHVMGAWARSLGAEGKIRFLADGNGELTRALGMDVDMSPGGMGIRSRRYSMLVENGVVTQLNVEQAKGLNVSAAATLLDQLESQSLQHQPA